MTNFTWEAMAREFAEAATTLSEQYPAITPAQVERALLNSLRTTNRSELISNAWTADMIVHTLLDVDFDAPGSDA